MYENKEEIKNPEETKNSDQEVLIDISESEKLASISKYLPKETESNLIEFEHEIRNFLENDNKTTKSSIRVILSERNVIGVLLLIYSITIVGGSILFSSPRLSEDKNSFRELLSLVVTTQSTLMASIIGFYFGKNSK